MNICLNPLKTTLAEMRKDNLLGKNILGKKGFDYDISIRLGSGAYVCGEETALIESLEGYRGEPRNRPPYPVDTGYLGYPTAVNNCETLASAAHIVTKGGGWFKKFGTDKSSGSKLFSVSGDCEFPGVYEVAWGLTIQELLDLVGARNTKAVQIGGASGFCIPKSQFTQEDRLRRCCYRRIGNSIQRKQKYASRTQKLYGILCRRVLRTMYSLQDRKCKTAGMC